MREVAEVHRDLFREHAARYGENTRVKIERCLAVSDEEFEEELRAREAYRERCVERLEGVDLLLTPTTPFVAPFADVDELTIRDAAIRFTYPFNVLGWPATASASHIRQRLANNRREPESSSSLEVDGNRYAIGMRQRESAGRSGVPG